MKKVGFEERLDDIMVCAAIRLQKRMAMVGSFRGLVGYLTRAGLWADMGVRKLQGLSRSEVEDRAAMALARKLRRARKTGTLRAVLQQLNMQELLQPRAKEHAVHQGSPVACACWSVRRVCGAHDGPESEVSPTSLAARPLSKEKTGEMGRMNECRAGNELARHFIYHRLDFLFAEGLHSIG